MFDALLHPSAGGTLSAPVVGEHVDPLVDDDLHLALYCLYELAYRGFHGVEAARETDIRLVGVRQRLAAAFEAALRRRLPPPPDRATVNDTIGELLGRFDGPSLSSYMVEQGTLAEFREFLVHRSAYQLKEADPHSWVIPRLPPGPRKRALLEIQGDEYGGGVAGASHAELFADAMDAAGLDPTYGAQIERLPGVTLATCNLISLFGSERRLAGAVLGHLAVFEMTSVEPMARYSAAARSFGLPSAVRRFYDVHVEADVHHGHLARTQLLGGDFDADGIVADDVIFGAQALLDVENRFACHLLTRWANRESSFYSGPRAAVSVA